jgi:DNA-binding NarL/FixJ family response regulator
MREPSDVPVDARTVGSAVVGVLRELAQTSPVLVAIDDVQWLDSATAGALGFGLRRLTNARVGVLCAQRREPTPALLLSEATHLEVRAVSLSELHAILVERGRGPLARPQLERLHALCGGNPLYALELAAIGADPDVGRVPPMTIQQAMLERIRRLSREVRETLAAAALAPELDVAAVARASGGTSALDTAVEAGVINWRGGGLAFAHPLLGEAAAESVGPVRRRELHHSLADAARSEEQRARHMALAVVDADPAVGEVLADAAEGALRRGALQSAIELAQLAVRHTLTSEPELLRVRRLRLAVLRVTAGDFRGPEAELPQLVRELPGGALRAQARYYLAATTLLHNLDGAVALLADALEDTGDRNFRLTIVRAFCSLQLTRGDIGAAHTAATALCTEMETADDRALLAFALAAKANVEIDAGGNPEGVIQRALALSVDAPEIERLHSPLHVLGRLRTAQGRFAEARTALEQAARESEERGEEIWRGHFLRDLGALALGEGRFDEARRLADEGVAHATQAGVLHWQSDKLRLRARALAVCGEHDAARAAAEQSIELAGASGAEHFALLTTAARGFAALSADAPQEAAGLLAGIPEALDSAGYAVSLPGEAILADAVEASALTGDLTTTRMLVALAEKRPDETAGRSRAVLMLAEGCPREAVELLTDAPQPRQPFEAARAKLVLGRAQRGARLKAAARDSLEEARETFIQLGAPTWAAKADAELARLSGRRAQSGLTPTEVQVAELVAQGMTNREVAAALVVTVSAVEAHLTRIYAKLGIRSRTALARRLETNRTARS